MATTFQLTLCLGMLAMCLAVPTKTVRWCLKSEAEMKKCRELSRTCGSDDVTLSCVHKANTDDCIKAIANGLADAIALDSGDIYKSSRPPYNLKPIIAENYGTAKDPDTCYYAVALVKKSSTFTINDLKGKKSCHTAVSRTAGWIVPFGALRSLGLITWDGPEEQNPEKAMAGFFTASCAPGAKEEKLCKLCTGKKEWKCTMSDNEPYYGYEGARRCLKDGGGDVAFVKHKMPEKYHQDYELLCTNGERKPVSEYEKCFWGRVPSHCVVSINDEDTIKTITDFLLQAQSKPSCKLFDSPNNQDLMFKHTANGFIPLPAQVDAFMLLGRELFNAMKAMHTEVEQPSEDKIRWCTQSIEEKVKCDTWSIASEGAIECVEASMAEECITMILKNEADAVTLDAGYLYTAGECGLVPVMGEIYDFEACKKSGPTSGSYFAVAIKKATDKDITWNNLEGKKTCHTAVGRTAGWVIPTGLIFKKTGKCDMSTYFKESCAPGADPNSNLCKLCVGDPQKSLDGTKCSPNKRESYYGYHGAFRCLCEVGEVAFLKHTTAFEIFKDNPAWLNGKKEEDFLLLCPDGTTRPLSEYRECNLANVPTHVVVATPTRRSLVLRILKEQQHKFGRKEDKSSQMFSMFYSQTRSDLLFKDLTQCLREVTGTMTDFLGEDYIKAIASANACRKSELLKACTFHTCKL
ncbi:serotransferrin-like [Leptodactylus fuscus]|uniref:serotransferrin-like n=1 Tax=Leptodactylus fuscus TaxID=238119 RepID=UPI003F4ED4BE